MKYAYAHSDLTTINYNYLDLAAGCDNDVTRVASVSIGSGTPVSIAEYHYNGVGTLVNTFLDEPNFTYTRAGSTSGTYADWDRFNRVTSDIWKKENSTPVNLFSVDVTWDRDSNITRTEDNVYPAGRDVQYTMDNLNRLTKAEEGDWNGSSITNRSRQQIWTLTQTGNWDREKHDLNGDNDFVDSGEHDDTRTHSDANELLTRDTDSNSTVNYSLAYDKNGNETDDGENYTYIYDGFGRPRMPDARQVKNRSNRNLVEKWPP